MIAAVLDRQKGARMILEARHGRRRAGAGREYVADGEAPAASLKAVGGGLLRIAEHARDLRHVGETLRIDLGGATGDDDVALRPLPLQAADGLARLARRLGGDGAGVDDDDIAALLCGCEAAHCFRFDEIEPAAEGHDLDPALRRGAHAGTPSNRAASSGFSYSKATGPVMIT